MDDFERNDKLMPKVWPLLDKEKVRVAEKLSQVCESVLEQAEEKESNVHLNGTAALLIRPWQIYTLIDPRNGQVRYLGVTTVGIKKRLRSHISESRRSKTGLSHRINWIKELLNQNLKPLIRAVESGIGSGWADKERQWIRELKERGVDLVNATDGGEGVWGLKTSPESRAKMSASAKGKPKKEFTEEHRKNMSIAAKKRPPRTEEHRRKLGNGRRGKPLSKESIAKRNETIRIKRENGYVKKYSTSAIKNMSDAGKKRMQDPEQHEKTMACLRKAQEVCRKRTQQNNDLS